MKLHNSISVFSSCKNECKIQNLSNHHQAVKPLIAVGTDHKLTWKDQFHHRARYCSASQRQ